MPGALIDPSPTASALLVSIMFSSRATRSCIQYRNLVSCGRVPSRRHLHIFRPPADTSVQEVRLKKPSIFSWKRVASFGIYSSCAAASYFYVLPEIEIEEVSENEIRDDGESDSPEIADPDEDSIFIPLGFAKRKERSFYRGSDPEWQEFIKLANNKPRHRKVQQDLVSLIMMHVITHAAFAQSLGGTPKAGKIWLDIQFPNGPPPEFERTGIIITDDYMALAKRTSSEMEEHRINRTLWPSAAFYSIYASMRVLWRVQWQRAKDTLGIQTKPTREDEQIRQSMQAIHQLHERHLGRPGTSLPEPSSDVAKQSPSEQGQVQPPATPTAKNAVSSRHSADPRPATSSLPKLTPSSLPSGSEIPLAYHVFHSTMAQNMTPKKLEAPRGTCVLSGLIEVSGSKARATLDVKAAYHPQQRTFVAINVGIRSFKPYRQSPIGGP